MSWRILKNFYHNRFFSPSTSVQQHQTLKLEMTDYSKNE